MRSGWTVTVISPRYSVASSTASATRSRRKATVAAASGFGGVASSGAPVRCSSAIVLVLAADIGDASNLQRVGRGGNALANLLLEEIQPMQQHLRRGRAARHVDIHRHDFIHALDDG